MARFILTSREFFPVLTSSRGSPALLHTPFLHTLPSAGEVVLSPCCTSEMNIAKGTKLEKLGPELGNLDPSRIFTMTYFSWALSSAVAAQGSHLSTTGSFTLQWIERQKFNLHRDQLELLLTREEHRNNIEIMGRAYIHLYYKNRDIRNLHSPKTHSPLETDFDFL